MLGATQTKIKVFQPFFIDVQLPVALTRGDQVSLPIVAYNYQESAQEVTLKIKREPWFSLLDLQQEPDDSEDEPYVLKLKLEPHETRSVYLPIQVEKVGRQQLEIIASSKTAGDAIRKEITVLPGGKRVEQVVSGSLESALESVVHLPADAIEQSSQTWVYLYPSTFSQLVEGIDTIFRMPSGCFEQTSSTTYPNILALQYLRTHDKTVPAVEAKARSYIHKGYQRLLSFEVPRRWF